MNWELDEALDAEALLLDEYREAHTVTIDKGNGCSVAMFDGEIIGISIVGGGPAESVLIL